MTTAAIEKLNAAPHAIIPRMKRRVGYCDTVEEQDNVQGTLKKMRLDSEDKMTGVDSEH